METKAVQPVCSGTMEMLDRFGLAIQGGTVVMTDFNEAGNCYIHHSQAPVALAGFTMVSPVFARGRFPKLSFVDLIRKRPAMDESEVLAFATICSIEVQPPFWGHPAPFAAHLWEVIARYKLGPFFERIEQRLSPGQGDHYLMRPRGFNWGGDWEPNPDVLKLWRANYRKLDMAHQLMVATILQLYRMGDDTHWMVRVPKTWHAADGVEELRRAGFLADWARLFALYPGW